MSCVTGARIRPRPFLALLVVAALTCAATSAQEAAPAADPGAPWALAAARADIAHQALRHARGVLDGWWALRDAATGLLPRRTDQSVWAPQDNAADCFPFLLLAAYFTAPERFDDVASLMRREVELTTRLGGLPDWYDIQERRFLHATPDVPRIIFGAAEYAKDGLNPLIERLGPVPWSARMRQLLEGLLELAPVETAFGRLPADDTEVNGDVLQALLRFYFLTGEEKFLAGAERIGDAYALEVLPQGGGLPAHRWDFAAHRALADRFSLNDHGNEIAGGLAELYAAAKALARPSAGRLEAPLRRMFDLLLDKARNADGLWHSLLEASTGKVLEAAVPDTWGYALTAVASFGRATGDPRYAVAVRRALRSLDQDRYLEWNGADSYADSIEGALLLLNRFPEPAGFTWLSKVLPRFWARQKLPDRGGTGIVEGWYGDGNYARTALMVAEWATQGVRAAGWNDGVRLGACADPGRLHLVVRSARNWHGRLAFDHPRHRDFLRLPHDDPRLNSWPEWWPVEAGNLYRIELMSGDGPPEGAPFTRLGSELIAGLPVDVPAGQAVRLLVTPAGPPPYGQESPRRDPIDGLAAGRADPALLASKLLDSGESHTGETYHWLARGPILWKVERAGGPVDATLWLRWGSKKDVRAAQIRIGEHVQTVARGGADGFEWVPVDVPLEWWEGNALRVSIEAPADLHGRRPGFLAALALRRITPDDGGDPSFAARQREALLRPPAGEDLAGRIIDDLRAAAEKAHEAVATHQYPREDWEPHRLALRQRLQRALGLDPWPERTPLNVRPMGVTERDGYRIERVVFDSRPLFPVTANVYVPVSASGETAPRRLPAVLCPLGHWTHSKAEPVVQARCIALAKLGYVVLAYDPFGQGERAVPGNAHDEAFRSLLVGWSNLTFMVWDSMRALDYLTARSDVDPDRIAATGASGGGLNTLYTAALDDRIKVAVPVVYVTRLREFLETRITHCPCSHVPGLATFADMGDVLALLAPRPTLLLTAARDAMFPPAGAREAEAQARGAFRVYAADDRLAVREFDSGHDYNQPMREAMYAWLAVHLRGAAPGPTIAEPPVATEPVDSEALRCFPEGRVPSNLETVRSLSLARAAAFARRAAEARRPSRLAPVPPALVPRESALRSIAPDAALLALYRRQCPADSGEPRILQSVEGLSFVGWQSPGLAPDGPFLVVLADSVGDAAPLIAATRSRASSVLVLAMTGSSDRALTHLAATDSVLLGDPLPHRRARALAALLRDLRSQAGSHPLVLAADGPATSVVALLALVGHPDADVAAIRGLPASLVEVFAGDALPLDSVCPDHFEWRDFPDLMAATGIPVNRLDEGAFGPALFALLARVRR